MKHLEIPYIELGAVLTAGAVISRIVLQRESIVDTTIDIMTTAGTYLVSKAALQLSRSVREATVQQESQNALLPGAEYSQRKKVY